ncbi:MAG: ATP-binding cassette domain-containing protein [Chitinophagia bacterium]
MAGIKLKDVSVFLGGRFLLNNINLIMNDGEQWAIIGNSGSGKTTLAKALGGQLFYRGDITFVDDQNIRYLPKIHIIEQQHVFRNKSNGINFYYQQRFNSADAEDTHDVETELGDTEDIVMKKWIEVFGLKNLLKKPLIQLSNGENKRLQLAKAMKQDPDILILDNPFIGLDIEGRKTLQDACQQLINIGKQIILISSMQDLPNFITDVAVLEEGSIISTTTYDEHQSGFRFSIADKHSIEGLSALEYQETASEEIIKMKDVSISYNNIPILHNINWLVKKGERWCVTGHNGSGKSTLLSLISADNPQAYANQIYLFGKRRGTGESIWDIKKKIGYISPELHLFFEKGESVFNAVASGLYDTIGLFRHVSEPDQKVVEKWLNIMGLLPIKEKRLSQLSLGEQRTVMLTRALVKTPPLLILDEPCQGLDKEQTERFKSIIDGICLHSSTSLIYVSHYEEDIPGCIHRFLKLEKGKIAELI